MCYTCMIHLLFMYDRCKIHVCIIHIKCTIHAINIYYTCIVRTLYIQVLVQASSVSTGKVSPAVVEAAGSSLLGALAAAILTLCLLGCIAMDAHHFRYICTGDPLPTSSSRVGLRNSLRSRMQRL